jgi:hypothetical protein
MLLACAGLLVSVGDLTRRFGARCWLSSLGLGASVLAVGFSCLKLAFRRFGAAFGLRCRYYWKNGRFGTFSDLRGAIAYLSAQIKPILC